jgi:hypothetical protein
VASEESSQFNAVIQLQPLALPCATVGLGVEWAFAGKRHLTPQPELYRQRIRHDTITVNNRSINMLTVALNYKFGGWWY